MCKGTKKKIINGILIIFVIIFAFLASIVAAFRDVTMQSMIARSFAGDLSRKLNTDVKIRTFYITEKLDVCVEGVQIKDLYGYPMFSVGTLNARVSPTLDLGNIRLWDVYLKDVMGRVVKYEGDTMLNINEVLAQLDLGGGGDSDSDMHLLIDNLQVDNGHVVYWDQTRDHPEKMSMDYFHIDIDSIYGTFHNLEIRNDSILSDVLALKGKDRSGLTLDSLSAKVLFCEKCLNIDNLLLHSNESHIDIDLRFEYERSSCYYEFVDSVRIISDIRPTTMLLSDLRYFAWILDKMPDKFNFTGKFDGYVKDFKVSDFVGTFGNESNIDFDIAFAGLPDFFETQIEADIRRLETSYDDTRMFAIPIAAKTVPIPASLEEIGKYTLKGTFKGYPEDFVTKFDVTTEIGDVDADIRLKTKGDSKYDFAINANNLDLKSILDFDEGSVTSFDLSLNGEGLDVDEANVMSDLHFTTLRLQGIDFNDFGIHSTFNNSYLKATTAVDFPYLDMNLRAGVDLRYDKPLYDVKAMINNIDLVKLKLIDYDTIMLLSADIDAEVSGDDIDNLRGHLYVNDLKYNNGDDYYMRNLMATVVELPDGFKDIDVNCDFFNLSLDGKIKFNTLANTMKNTALRYLNKPAWYGKIEPDVDNQDFELKLELNNTWQLTQLFAPSLYLSDDTDATLKFSNDKTKESSLTIVSPEIMLGDVRFVNVNVNDSANIGGFFSKITIDDIILRDSTNEYSDKINIENVAVTTALANDTINTLIAWDDNDDVDRNKAYIESTFVPYDRLGGLLHIASDEIRINDTLWQMNPNCYIDFKDNSTTVNDFEFYTETQKIALHGLYPKRDQDTLSAMFHNVNISDFDFITMANLIDMDGILDGTMSVTGLNENLSFSSDISVDALYLNGKDVGDVIANAHWYKPTESIRINMNVNNKSFEGDSYNSVVLFGFYYPKRSFENIEFDVSFKDFKLETLSPFISVVSRLDGLASGSLNMTGSIAAPDIKGEMRLANAGCHINYLNTFYRINNTIKIQNDRFVFDNIVLTDTVGHEATIKGNIYHDHLTDFNMDLSMSCKDFVALDIPKDRAEGFYGSAVADGTVTLKGPLNNIVLDIDITTKNGTDIGIPLSESSVIDNSFVVFVNDGVPVEEEKKVELKPVKKNDGFTLNLNSTITPEASLSITLPQNMGSINARGIGNIKLGYNSSDFNLRGRYTITSGSFTFSFNMVKRTFLLRRGGTISWTGDPEDADINIVGVYRSKASLVSLGSSAVDSSALTNNVNVDCIIRLSDKMMNPTINFGIELPNATEDTKNLVYSVIDTTNQGIMAQQVLSLIVLKTFANPGQSNISHVGATAGYSVITSQLSSWLSQISDAFEIGINYTPDDDMTNEEIEVALTTQLFDDRLTVEGNFGVIRGNKSEVDNANNIVGDVDLTWAFTRRLSLKAYNHTNVKNNYYYYTIEDYSDYTQGVGISYSFSDWKTFGNDLMDVITGRAFKKKGKKDESAPK